MELKQPLLSVAIPTYNRSANLAALLDGLASQVAAESRVELLISDNCSSDDTQEIVHRFINQGLRCRYIRNEINIGPDLNFLQCYNLAEGQYVWIFGDDDVILPGSLEFILGQIDGRHLDLVYLAPFGFVHDPAERGCSNPRPASKQFNDVRRFIHAVGLCGDFALISALLVNKQRVESHQHPPYTDALNSNLLQLGWVFTALNHFQSGLVIQSGLYAVCEKNPSRPFDVARVFGENWYGHAKVFLDEGSIAQNAVLNDQLYSWFPTNWFGQRKASIHTQTVPPHQLMRPLYGGRPLYWFCVYPLLTWPRLFAGGWLVVLRSIRKMDRMFHGLS
jgi:abequosyltransferase